MSQVQNLIPARITSPGQILKRELDARGWTQKDLAEILGRPQQEVDEIIKGAKQITPETAIELAEAFGTSPDLWNNLEADYRL
ncbi:MAG: HigA family addiction module antitoxin [Firmicutes bacterium]|nr:HigA family addiction module antitoxin [Bacillota bacterium]